MGKRGDKAEVVASVRAAVAAEDFSGAERLLHSYQEEKGITPKGVEALS